MVFCEKTHHTTQFDTDIDQLPHEIKFMGLYHEVFGLALHDGNISFLLQQ